MKMMCKPELDQRSVFDGLSRQKLIIHDQTPKPKKKRPAAVDPDGDEGGEDRPTKKTKLWVIASVQKNNAETYLQQIRRCVERY
jgi:hypothetical protein